MKKVNTTALFLSILVLCMILANTGIFSYLKEQMYIGQGNFLVPDWLSIIILINILVTGIFHLFALLTLVLQFKSLRIESFSRSIAFVFGLFSLFLLFVDVVMLSDIGKEYMYFQDLSGEWQFLFINHICHIIFALMMIVQCIFTQRRMKETPKPVIIKDEALFLSIHQIGISTAILGFVWIFILLGINTPKAYINNIIVFSSIIILISYGLPAGYWFIAKCKEKLADWYDEKQFIDISRGALASLVVSVPVMTILFLLISIKAIDAGVTIWFPLYLFTTLLTFSGSTLYFAQRTQEI